MATLQIRYAAGDKPNKLLITYGYPCPLIPSIMGAMENRQGLAAR